MGNFKEKHVEVNIPERSGNFLQPRAVYVRLNARTINPDCTQHRKTTRPAGIMHAVIGASQGFNAAS